jgi:predicted nucleic acid-binding protein
VIVDTGVLVAAANRKDPVHARCRDLLASVTPLIVPATVIAEATYLVARELGPRVEAALLRSLATDRYLIEAPIAPDLLRAAKLVEQYEDLPLGATDALVVATAERFGDPQIATLDRRHFTIVRSALSQPLELVP